ncbi:ATP-dependent DNA helicase RecQ [Pirellulimonas nuda]|uniref:DNA helicase RecQ n=1 Tax=Pirellulimonas nuda TaxID=2528009 RepID=A0A518DJJ2_9BACT|nr:DNA helicase RecQ [Pirellulimonas nuda]QDU91650.1 ATP-dependent DNA helicase RecQ [Pirellulimonas nuda]
MTSATQNGAAPTDHTQRLLPVLQEYWGYDSFRPLQAEAMGCVLSGRDSVVVLPTGGGKSLCFQAPALAMEGLAVVVSPLISLMKDQVDALTAGGASAAFVNSTLSADERRDVAERVRSGEVKLLYAAPERLLAARTLEFLQSVNVSLFAIDEAHCISSWGHDFRPEYRGLRTLKERFPGVGIHAYTATASEQVRQDIAQQLGLQDPEFLVGSFDRPNLLYRVRHSQNRFGEVCDLVNARKGDSGIVYCISRKEVDATAAALRELGVRAAPYHAGLSDSDRQRNQDRFLKEEIDVVVATVAFGMGIDKSNVRYVIHAGMPKSLEAYQQESGRAGRDGLDSECTLLYQPRDAMTWRRLMASSGENHDGALAALAGMEAYASGVVCRHRALVGYFGQDLGKDNCGACDICLAEVDLIDDPLVTAQKIVSCVARLEERFGGDYTAKVLAGSREQRIVDQGHDRLSTHGLLEADGVKVIRGWIDQLMGQGYLEKAGEFGTLAITATGWSLLKGEASPRLARPAVKKAARRAASGGAELSPVDQGLFEALRALRMQFARERGAPPYVIFGDAALQDMARQRPGSLEAFAEVKGVGQKKLDDFGDAFVEAIVAYCSEQGLPVEVEGSAPAADAEGSPRRAGEPSASAPGVSASALAAFKHFRERSSMEEVAKQMNRARSTVAGYLGEFLRHEQVTDPSPWVDPETARRVEAAIEEVGLKGLRPIYEQLGEEVDYESIKVVATCIANRQHS